jgi:hypothetical protein
MKKNFFSALLLCAIVLLSSCGGDSAGRVNDILVSKSDKVVELMEKVGDHIQKDEYDNAKAYLDSVAVHVATSEPIISALNNKSAEDLKKVTLEYLNLFNAGVADYKQAIELYISAQDNEQMEKANKLINDFIEKTQEKMSEMQDVQAVFAKANNIILR